MKVVSLFSGCGGLDLGFEQAGFDVVWANEFDRTIWDTYKSNHPRTYFSGEDLRTIKSEQIPDSDGIIGGPPCQSWSVGGRGDGIEDERGRLFFDYIRVVEEKKTKFFLIENVAGILEEKHRPAFDMFLSRLTEAGYDVKYSLLNAADYEVPQDRFRVFIIGFRKDLKIKFQFPDSSSESRLSLRLAIGDIVDAPVMSIGPINTVSSEQGLWNHDAYSGRYSENYMRSNRVRSWDEVSYTIQAQASNAPQHPQAPKMPYSLRGGREFKKGYEHMYRRLSVRECARIQTFPDTFRFYYEDVKDGYKMVGNAVPPRLAYILAQQIMNALVQKTSEKKKGMHGVPITEVVKTYPENIVENYFSRRRQIVENMVVDDDKPVLICYVKENAAKEYADHVAKIYYTGKRFPSTFALDQLYYFMPYLKGKGVRDLYLIKSIRYGSKHEVNPCNDDKDLRIIFEIEFVKKLFQDYFPIHLNIWHTYTDTKLMNLMSIFENANE